MTSMADLDFRIDRPAPATVVGRKITVSGVAQTIHGHDFPHYLIAGVRVTVGDGGPVLTAQFDHGVWTCAGSLPDAVPGGSAVKITATAHGTKTVRTGGPNSDPTTEDEPFVQDEAVVVTLDGSVPDVTIEAIPSLVTVEPGEMFELDLSGRAGDAHTGISAVQLKVDDEPFRKITDVVDTGGGQRRWSRKGLKLTARKHHLIVRAVDGAGNHGDETADITVQEPLAPGERDQAFERTRYLLELVDFAHRYIKIDGTSGNLDAAMLAARFHQPFDRLTVPSQFERASEPVSQSRIAVEVLRDRLHADTPELDQRIRGLAYRRFLNFLGTSYEELRSARSGEPSIRERLAQRLGIASSAAQSDRLDELTISPESITDDELEELTGYRSTASGDPLRLSAGSPTVLLWRRSALRTQWRRDDDARRDSPDRPRPIIDPDVVGEGHLRSSKPDDPARSLWSARKAWIAGKIAEIDQELQAHVGQLARFDHAVTTYVGPVDLDGLAVKDADGGDVGPDLAPLHLDLDAFRFLARARKLLAGGQDPEWDDVVSVLAQVQKRRQYRGGQRWLREERRAGVVLDAVSFTLGRDAAQTAGVSHWRAQRAEYLEWRRTLVARTTTAEALESSYRGLVEATEDVAMPQLRDALVDELATPEERPAAAADRLSRELVIDLRAAASQRTTRVDQALESLRTALFSIRSGRLGAGSGPDWTIDVEPSDGLDFDREWDWMDSYAGWQSATRVFAYPDNQLFPTLYDSSVHAANSANEPPTEAYGHLIDDLREASRITPQDARKIAETYIGKVRDAAGLDVDFELTEQLSDDDLVSRRRLSRSLLTPPTGPKPHQREIFWLAPMAIAATLQESGQFRTALDWYRTVFAYHLPQRSRKIYYGLTLEGASGVQSDYFRGKQWLIEELNPHHFAVVRRNCYTRATIMAIVGCMNAFADAEFARNTADGNARARTLYETALDLLQLPEARPETGDDVPYPHNPVSQALRQHSRSGLDKIHRGLNIAGAESPGGGGEIFLPSQYRYGVLVERAKTLVATAQQVEASYLSALQQRDATAYDELRARNDLEVTAAAVTTHVTKLAEAVTGMRLADLQRQRAQVHEDHFADLIEAGPNAHEEAALASIQAAAGLHALAAVASGASIEGLVDVGGTLEHIASSLSAFSQADQMKASFERREEDWQLQRDLAAKDGAIADQQITLANTQFELANQEFQLALLQQNHAQAVASFLATRFTNTELFEWMTGVLGGVYAFFLQQATALARLAEAQLAFERQEPTAGFIGSDYWRDATAGADAPDRRGLTGSARLLEDITRLDQHAFDTDRRKLHLTQTFPLSQIGPLELQEFRQSGVLTIATPEVVFDREFPGHYLRLIKRVKVSLVALLPPRRGVRATLMASGVSRTVVARGPFDTVTLRRDPEAVAFTSPTDATGLFDLEPEGGLLLPFEGMGVDTVWRLELPKAANPFNFNTIADVLLTIEYTAMDSSEYREQVVRELDRKFTGDRTFSVRNQFSDAWYELNNPDTVEPEHRMRVTLPITADDLPPHIQDLRVEQISMFVVRADALADELTVPSLRHTVGGQTVTTGVVTTTGGIISTRRPAGAPWNVHLGADPTGTWEIQLPDEALVRSWFRDELIEDLVLVLTLGGTTPEWP